MKATLRFNLDLEDDREKYDDAIKATQVKCRLWDFEQALRSMYKYGGYGGKEIAKMTPEEVVDFIRETYYNITNEG